MARQRVRRAPHHLVAAALMGGAAVPQAQARGIENLAPLMAAGAAFTVPKPTWLHSWLSSQTGELLPADDAGHELAHKVHLPAHYKHLTELGLKQFERRHERIPSESAKEAVAKSVQRRKELKQKRLEQKAEAERERVEREEAERERLEREAEREARNIETGLGGGGVLLGLSAGLRKAYSRLRKPNDTPDSSKGTGKGKGKGKGIPPPPPPRVSKATKEAATKEAVTKEAATKEATNAGNRQGKSTTSTQREDPIMCNLTRCVELRANRMRKEGRREEEAIETAVEECSAKRTFRPPYTENKLRSQLDRCEKLIDAFAALLLDTAARYTELSNTTSVLAWQKMFKRMVTDEQLNQSDILPTTSKIRLVDFPRDPVEEIKSLNTQYPKFLKVFSVLSDTIPVALAKLSKNGLTPEVEILPHHSYTEVDNNYIRTLNTRTLPTQAEVAKMLEDQIWSKAHRASEKIFQRPVAVVKQVSRNPRALRVAECLGMPHDDKLGPKEEELISKTVPHLVGDNVASQSIRYLGSALITCANSAIGKTKDEEFLKAVKVIGAAAGGKPNTASVKRQNVETALMKISALRGLLEIGAKFHGYSEDYYHDILSRRSESGLKDAVELVEQLPFVAETLDMAINKGHVRPLNTDQIKKGIKATIVLDDIMRMASSSDNIMSLCVLRQ